MQSIPYAYVSQRYILDFHWFRYFKSVFNDVVSEATLWYSLSNRVYDRIHFISTVSYHFMGIYCGRMGMEMLLDEMQIPILIFLMSCIVESYIYSWLMVCTKDNLVSEMSYHFLWNLCIHMFAINPDVNQGSIAPYMIVVVLELFVLLIFYAKRKKNSANITDFAHTSSK